MVWQCGIHLRRFKRKECLGISTYRTETKKKKKKKKGRGEKLFLLKRGGLLKREIERKDVEKEMEITVE